MISPQPSSMAVAMRADAFVLGLGLMVILIASLVLGGWWADLSWLKSLHPALGRMPPWTAAGMILSGLGLVTLAAGLRARGWHMAARVVQVGCALGVLGLDGVVLLEHGLGLPGPAFDALPFSSDAAPRTLVAVPGRMSMTASVCFVLVGGALLAELGRGRFARTVFSFSASMTAVLALVPFVGHLYEPDVLYHVGFFGATALHTAFCFMVLGAGLLVARPDRGWVRVVASSGLGGFAARRLLPLGLFLPVVMGWTMLQVSRAFELNADFRLMVHTVIAVVLLIGLIWWMAHLLDEADRRRHASASALEDTEELVRALLDNAVMPIYVCDRDGRFVAVNRSFARLFHIERADALGKTAHEVLPPAAAEALARADRPILETGQPREAEESVSNGGKPRTYLSVRFPLRRAMQGIVGMGAIMTDISERIEMERSLSRAKAEADRANVAQSKFLAAASHDLRQPVQSLFFFIAALGQRLNGHPARDLLDTVEQALGALKLLLDALLEVSKLDAGLVVARPLDMPLQPLLERLRDDYGPAARVKGLDLRVVPSTAVVRSDPILLERMMRHLIENAIRYTERGRVLLGCRQSGQQMCIGVLDSGIGIDPGQHKEIFQEFYQIANPERDRAKGLGLGLAIVRRLGRLLGHEVEVRSALGRGAAFTVKMPLIARGRQVRPVLRAANQDVRGLVIVIDDEALVRLGIQAMLEGWGYEVLVAESAEEAVRILGSHGRPPDAIVADYRLRAGGTGTEAIHAIHAHWHLHIPSMIITGDTAPERLIEAENSGFALLHKPVAAHEFRRMLQQMLRAA